MRHFAHRQMGLDPAGPTLVAQFRVADGEELPEHLRRVESEQVVAPLRGDAAPVEEERLPAG